MQRRAKFLRCESNAGRLTIPLKDSDEAPVGGFGRRCSCVANRKQGAFSQTRLYRA
jgi:hypothetical protein